MVEKQQQQQRQQIKERNYGKQTVGRPPADPVAFVLFLLLFLSFLFFSFKALCLFLFFFLKSAQIFINLSEFRYNWKRVDLFIVPTTISLIKFY